MHIVVYAGPIKTACSTVKRTLERNRDALLRDGIEFFAPDVPNGWSEWSLLSLFVGPVVLASAALFPTPERQRAWSAEIWRDLEARIDRSTTGVMLIASEHFYNVRDKEGLVARLRQRADRLSFIAYARDPVSLFASGIDEAARGGAAFHDLPKPTAFPYPIRLMRDYAPLLDAGELIIRSFDPRAMVGGDIVTDFFHVLSDLTGRRIGPKPPVERVNESLGGAAALWLVASNALGPFAGAAAEHRNGTIDALYDDPALKGLPRLKMTDPEIDRAIRVRNRETLDWLNAGPLSHAPLQTAPPGAEALPEAELRDRMRDWLLSYARDDHMRLVLDAVMRHGAQIPG